LTVFLHKSNQKQFWQKYQSVWYIKREVHDFLQDKFNANSTLSKSKDWIGHAITVLLCWFPISYWNKY